MENEQQFTETPKIKIIGRIQNNAYHEQLLTDEAAPAECGELAKRLLQTFAPAALARELSQTYGKDSVLVFRTDAVQMEEFRSLLKTHGTSLL